MFLPDTIFMPEKSLIEEYRKLEFDDDALLRTLYKFVRDIEIIDFAESALDSADPNFWLDPCSSSGKYHPPENQGKVVLSGTQ